MNVKLYENKVMSASPNANLTIRRSHELEYKYINMKRKKYMLKKGGTYGGLEY